MTRQNPGGNGKRAAPKPRKGPRKPPDESSPVPPSDQRDPSWRSEGWRPEFAADSLVDYVADVVLAYTRDSIIAGRRPDGVEQPPLKEPGARWQAAKKGKRPPFRGWTGRAAALPLKIRRGALKRQGTVRASGPIAPGRPAPYAGTMTGASVTIAPHKQHRAFVGLEAARGVSYLSVEGEMAKIIDEAIALWVELALQGQPPDADPKERDAEDV